MEKRAIHGTYQIVPPGFNERLLAQAGLKLLEQHDPYREPPEECTADSAARMSHRTELEQLEGPAGFEREVQYLETVVASRKGVRYPESCTCRIKVSFPASNAQSA